MFHTKCGILVSLSNNNKTAYRNHPTQEFNNGVVMSRDVLQDNQLFEVRVDKKINSWSGSIEIGVTTCDPNNLQFPASATDFREGTWVLSGNCILMNGRSIVDEYGFDLDRLCEGDKVGVMRTTRGALHFFVNGTDYGEATRGIPEKVFVIVDMYGKCVQVTITESVETRIIANEAINESLVAMNNGHTKENNCNDDSDEEDRLQFHERCGSLIRLSSGNRTAERRRPLDEFNNGVIMSNRPLHDNEMFEITLDRLVDKWSGSIEVGITTHNPNTMEFPATMTNMRSGTIMMSGCGILTNGKGTRREYGDYNLDELMEGDRIGMIRKTNGNLHYYINGVDQGIAASRVPSVVFAVVDLYGMAVKVTLTAQESDRRTSLQQSLGAIFENRAHTLFQQLTQMYTQMSDCTSNLPSFAALDSEADALLFHPHCGSHARVVEGGRAAIRPNATVDFNNAVVLTNRPLRVNEMFEIAVDQIIDKWAGSIEIGVTTHLPLDLDFPATMTNIRSGTWMMTGNGVMHNGTTVLEEYGQNLDRLKCGDTVGVLRKNNGNVHFYVNSVDQGCAATDVPENVYGVIDLYGQAAKAHIVDHSATSLIPVSTIEDVDQTADANDEAVAEEEEEPLQFHHLHGRNATITNNGLTASRPNAHGEFNDAIVTSKRPLKDGEMFEVVIEKMVERWSGSIEAGVTTIRPDQLEFPNTMTDIDYETWMLSGSAIMQDGTTIRNGYACDLDTLMVGSRIGMSRLADGTLHFYVNGADMGVACTDVPPGKGDIKGVYAVIDLYGQCAQVTILNQNSKPVQPQNHVLELMQTDVSPARLTAEITHRLCMCTGKNILLKNGACSAVRQKNYNCGLVFSSHPMRLDELFEIQVDSMTQLYSGSLEIGVTTFTIHDNMPNSSLPASAKEFADNKSKVTWLISGSSVLRNNVVLKENFVPSLHRVEVGTKVGVMVCSDGTLHLFVNSEDMGVAATHIPKKVHALVDVYGTVDGISIVSNSIAEVPLVSPRAPLVHFLNREAFDEDGDVDTKAPISHVFHNRHGRNINLSNRNRTATRKAGYDQAIAVCNQPLVRQQLFEIEINQSNSRWSSGLRVGIVGTHLDKIVFPSNAVSMEGAVWIIQGQSVFHNKAKIKECYGPDLDTLTSGRVGLLIDYHNSLHMYVNGVDRGVAATDLPGLCFVLVDLYGRCDQVSIVTNDAASDDSSSSTSQQGEDKEKADIESNKTEKVTPQRTIEARPVENCDYMKACSVFVDLLGLPAVYFCPEKNVCFCEKCYSIQEDSRCIKGGDPPKDYTVPFGWCRFGLRIAPRFENINASENWHVAFHGTRIAAIRKILDHGELLLPGDVALGGKALTPYASRGKYKSKEDISQIFLSPSIRYIDNDLFATRQEWTDIDSKKQTQVRVAFQVCVRPGCYRVGPQSIGVNHAIDPHFSNNEIEWFTKERGATALYGLLVRLE